MQAKHGGLPAHRSRPLPQGALRSARLAAGKGRSRCPRGEIKPRSSPETDTGAGKAFDAAGAGKSWSSPGWLTQLGRLWGGETDTPVADAKPEDIQDLLGGALFQALYKWMLETGPVYLLPTGPVSSFLVVSDPEAARHVLRNTDSAKPIYDKGLVAEVSKFLFGDGFAVAGGENWKVRRKAVGPAFHRKYLEAMLERVFAPSALHLAEKLEEQGSSEGRGYNMEAGFSQMTLDVVGKAVFNYSFDSLTQDSPVIQAVYTALKETEQRATDLLPYWKVPLLCQIIPRQRKAMAAVQLIRDTTEELIQKCKEMVDAEEAAQFAQEEDYMNEADPSVLRFLIASREEVSASQLRDDLLSMLVAGHETTASALTWTVYLLCQNPTQMARAQEEVDRVLGDRDAPTTLKQYQELKYVMRCVNESMRLYPHPPVLLRRALVEDTLPGGYSVPVGQDVMISVYNIHHSPAVWDRPDDFLPERFDLDKPTPNEQNTDCRYIPFSGGPRKCIGDQFALMEAVVVLSVLLKRFDMRLVPDQKIGMTTGATIHTTNGLYIYAQRRAARDAPPPPAEVTGSFATSA